MHQLTHLHIANLRQHMHEYRVLTHIPVICCQNILGTLIQYRIQHQFILPRFLCHIKCHAVGTRIQMHFMQIRVHINIGHNTATVRIVFQIIDHTIHLIHHTFLILMLYAHLITICFSDGTGFICPLIPHMTVKIIDIVGFLLPDPEHLIRTALDGSSAQSQCWKFFGQIIAIYHTKLFDGVSTGSILPFRAHLFSLCAGSVFNNIFTHIDKNVICVTHLRPPIIFSILIFRSIKNK